jgi:hypothetical protein
MSFEKKIEHPWGDVYHTRQSLYAVAYNTKRKHNGQTYFNTKYERVEIK